MSNNIIFRKAKDSDIRFLVEAIINANKSGTDIISYCEIFSVSPKELSKILAEILAEDIQGQEFCVSDFLIAEIDGEQAGAVCSWIESTDSNSVEMLKANIFFHFFGKEKCEQAREKLKITEQITIPRVPGCIQIESVYVSKKFRGLGISEKLIYQQVKNLKEIDKNINKVQILLAKTNEAAYYVYKKIGFQIINEKHSDKPDILKILPSDTMIQMEISVENILNNN